MLIINTLEFCNDVDCKFINALDKQFEKKKVKRLFLISLKKNFFLWHRLARIFSILHQFNFYKQWETGLIKLYCISQLCVITIVTTKMYM